MKLCIPLCIIFAIVSCEKVENEPNDFRDSAPKQTPLESAVDFRLIQDRNGLAFVPNTERPYTGWVKKIYQNSQVELLAEFKDGYLIRMKRWRENGIPKSDIGFREGTLSLKQNVEDFESNFTKWHGEVTHWHENGKKRSSATWNNGVLDGYGVDFYDNGQIHSEGDYQNGEHSGKSFYKNGQKRSEHHVINYDITTLPDKLISAKVWKPNGIRCEFTNLRNGNGTLVSYHQNGQIAFKDEIKNGKKDGISSAWRESGSKHCERSYRDGKKDGLETFWYENEKVWWKAYYKNDKKHGKSTTWDEDGKIISEEIFSNGEVQQEVDDFESNIAESVLKLSTIGPVQRVIISDEGKDPKKFHEFKDLPFGWIKEISFSKSFRCYSSSLENLKFSVDGGEEKKVKGQGSGNFHWSAEDSSD